MDKDMRRQRQQSYCVKRDARARTRNEGRCDCISATCQNKDGVNGSKLPSNSSLNGILTRIMHAKFTPSSKSFGPVVTRPKKNSALWTA